MAKARRDNRKQSFTTKPRFYKNRDVKSWEKVAATLLNLAGIRLLPEGFWAWGMNIRAYAYAGDIDNRVQAVTNACKRAIGVDDAWVYFSNTRKYWVDFQHKDEQRVEVRLNIVKLEAKTVKQAKELMNRL